MIISCTPSKYIVDPYFRALVGEPTSEKLAKLQQDILKHGCLEPIVTWNNYIIDGHHRYEICTANGIPFRSTSVDFSFRDLVICWICHNELQKDNLPVTQKMFLLGKLVLLRKKRYFYDAYPTEQYTAGINDIFEPLSFDSIMSIYEDLCARYQITLSTVIKRRNFAEAMDIIFTASPEFFRRVLSGGIYLSVSTAVFLASAEPVKLRHVIERLMADDVRHVRNTALSGLFETVPDPTPPTPVQKTVKDDPGEDPDMAVRSMTLTIPTWCSSLNRVRTDPTYPSLISPYARKDFKDALSVLHNLINEIVNEI